MGITSGVHLRRGRPLESLVSECGFFNCGDTADLDFVGQRDEQANRETSGLVDELAKGITKSMSIKV